MQVEPQAHLVYEVNVLVRRMFGCAQLMLAPKGETQTYSSTRRLHLHTTD